MDEFDLYGTDHLYDMYPTIMTEITSVQPISGDVLSGMFGQKSTIPEEPIVPEHFEDEEDLFQI